MKTKKNDYIQISNAIVVDFKFSGKPYNMMELLHYAAGIDIKKKELPFIGFPLEEIYPILQRETTDSFIAKIIFSLKDEYYDSLNIEEKFVSPNVTKIEKMNYYEINNMVSMEGVVKKMEDIYFPFMEYCSNQNLLISDYIYHQISKTDILKVKLLINYKEEREQI